MRALGIQPLSGASWEIKHQSKINFSDNEIDFMKQS